MTRHKGLQTAAAALSIFALLYALNTMMPLHRDDYDYSMVWMTARHITSFGDVLESVCRHYLLHGGRAVTVFFLDTFLLLGKSVFDFANALVFLALVVLMAMHARRGAAFWREPGIFAAAGLLTWLCLPHFGEVAVWKSGSTVYLWSAVPVLLFLLPYNVRLRVIGTGKEGTLSHRRIFAVPLFLLGIVAGWSVENLAVTTVVVSAGISFYAYRKGAMMPWMPAGALGALLGLIGLIGAPGNFVRYDAQGSGKGILTHIGNQFAGNGEMVLYILPAILLLILAWRLYRLRMAGEEVGTPSERKHGIGRFLLAAFVAFLVVSYFNGGFVAWALRDFLVGHVLVPLGLDKPKTIDHFNNIMHGFEEMAIYWLAIFLFYSWGKERLGLQKARIRALAPVPRCAVLARFPVAKYASRLIALALFNNFVMIAAPTFPARATFSSTVMILIAVLAVLRDPVVAAPIAARGRKLLVTAGGALGTFTMAAALVITHEMDEANAARLAIVERAAASGDPIACMEPIRRKNRALRHVFFVDFDNGVTKDGLCKYFGIANIKVTGAK